MLSARERKLVSQKKWRNNNKEKQLELQRKWKKIHWKESKLKYQLKYPEKHLAHKAIERAVESGQIKKGKCSICGSENTHGHHPDYNKPLEVIWLCPQHHKDVHS